MYKFPIGALCESFRLPTRDAVKKVNVQLTKRRQSAFAGLDHNENVEDGYLYDMENMSGDMIPVLSVRKGRTLLQTISNFHGFGSADNKLYWVSGTKFYYDYEVKGTVADSDKKFGRLGNRILIYPDKKYYEISTGTFGDMEISWSGSASVTSYTWDTTSEEAADVYQGNAIKTTGAAFPFTKGEAIFIEGSSVEGNNRSAVVQRVEENGKMLVFTNNLFEEHSAQTLTIRRKAPDMEWFCSLDNRLWGCSGDDIYSCALGLPLSWYDYDLNAGSSFAVPVGSDGSFTGAASLGGYAIFFKPDAIHKIYGDKPSNFQALESAVSGTIDGRSLAIANETLFYLSRTGIMAYKGGTPVCISDALGTDRYTEGVAGSDGRRYYVSLYNGYVWRLYVYDTWTGLWFIEDPVQVLGFAMADGVLYMVDDLGQLWSIGTEDSDGVNWEIITGDYMEGDPDKTGLGKLQIRMELDRGASATICIEYDGRGFHVHRTVRGEQRKQTFCIPIIPRRCDHYRIRIYGTGGCRIYSIAREYYQASEI